MNNNGDGTDLSKIAVDGQMKNSIATDLKNIECATRTQAAFSPTRTIAFTRHFTSCDKSGGGFEIHYIAKTVLQIYTKR